MEREKRVWPGEGEAPDIEGHSLDLCKIEIMAGPETDAQFYFTGIEIYFNPYMLPGRMTCVLATSRGVAFLVLYFKLRSKKTPAVKAT